MAVDQLVEQFSSLENSRCAGKIEPRLLDILVIAVCAVIGCAESWNDIALYGRSKEAWLKTFLDLPNGIPPHDTFRRVFMLIDPDTFEIRFAAWARPPDPERVLAWSLWRCKHQQRARRCHWKRRTQHEPRL